MKITAGKDKKFSFSTFQNYPGLTDLNYILLKLSDGTQAVPGGSMTEVMKDATVLTNGGSEIEAVTPGTDTGILTASSNGEFDDFAVGDIVKLNIDGGGLGPKFYKVVGLGSDTITLDEDVDLTAATSIKVAHVPNTGTYKGTIAGADSVALIGETCLLAVESKSKAKYDEMAQVEFVEYDTQDLYAKVVQNGADISNTGAGFTPFGKILS